MMRLPRKACFYFLDSTNGRPALNNGTKFTTILSRCVIILTGLATALFPSVQAVANIDDIVLPDDLYFLRHAEVTVPLADKVFEVDGRISPVESDASAQVRRGLTWEASATGDDRLTLHLAHTGDQLYVGFEIRVPAGTKLTATASERGDSALWKPDDSLEMRLIVDEVMYAFIGNAAGVRGELIYHPRNMQWRSEDWSFNARETAGGWEGEFLIDATVFGLDHFEPGSVIRADMFNNFKSGRQSGWAYQRGRWNAHTESWPRMVFGGSDAPYVKEEALGIIDGKMGFESVLANPSDKPRQVDVFAYVLRVKDESVQDFSYFQIVEGMFGIDGIDILPGADEAERLSWVMSRSLLPEMVGGFGIQGIRTIEANETERIALRRPQFPGKYLTLWRIADVGTGQIISAGAYPFSDAPSLDTSVEYHYLTAGEIEVRTDVHEDANLKTIRYTILNTDGVKIGQLDVEQFSAGKPLVTTIPVTDWPHGTLQLAVQGLSNAGTVIAEYNREIEHPVPPTWWGSDVGNLVEVPWPWTPVEARPNEASVWGRTYAWGDGPMPASIVSQGEELLAAPMRLMAKLSGKGSVEWHGSAPKLVEISPGKVVYRSRHQADDLILWSNMTLEFDGMLRVDLELGPSEQTPVVEELFLEIPVGREHAELFSVRIPGAGYAAGLVGDETRRFGFSPFLHVASERRGIEWFAEQDWFWSNANEDNKIEIVPDGDRVTLRIRLIDKPTKIIKERRITFGLQAWPVKPWPEQDFNVSTYLGGAVQTPGKGEVSLHPGVGGTQEQFKKSLRQGIEHGMNIMEIFHWSGAWGGIISIPDYPQIEHVDYPAYNSEVYPRVQAYGELSQEFAIPFIGHSGYAMPTYVPDYAVWGREMLRQPPDHRGAYGYKQCPQSPYTDGYVTRFKELAEETGWSGVQTDGTLIPALSMSERHGTGWRDENGKLHGSFPIFAYRELARRLYNVFNEEVDFPGLERGFVYNHGPGRPTAVFGFSHAVHSGESREMNLVDSLAEFSPDLPRALYPDSATGIPFHLLMQGADKVNYPLRGRIGWALQMGWNLRQNRILNHLDATYGEDDYPVDRVWKARQWVGASPANFHGYWSNGDYVRVSPENVYAGFHLNEGERMLLGVTNWHPEGRRVDVRLDLDALGFGDTKIMGRDAITGEDVELNDGQLTFDIERDGYRLVKIWREDANE